MKYIKTYEKYITLNDEDSTKLEIFIRDFVDKQNIPDKIKKMRLTDFINECFDYIEIFSNFISTPIYGQKDNLYYAVDFIWNYEYIFGKIGNRNTTFDIITKLRKENTPQFDNKLIKIFNKI
jgi:hypothetical protein